ncbi:MAG TPA: hypothetical protein DHW22_13985 [Planctomycetaceae bacterium]|nr:hypothetical protein [Planctomycetaceae bacterium]
MTESPGCVSTQLRWSVYSLLIALAVGNMGGRLFSVNSVNRIDLERHLIRQDLRKAEQRLKQKELSDDEFQKYLAEVRQRIHAARRLQRPFLSANDRSRWLAIRALVELGTYEIDDLLDSNNWNTIDMVQHEGRDGKKHLYSSKPPLLITLLAGEYWLVHSATGMTLESHPFLIGRLMLVTINILPMMLMFFLLAKMAERLGTSDWSRIFMVSCATLGTLLTPFAVVLNNHIVAAVSTSIALYAFMRIWFDGENRTRYYVICGLAAAFTAANELPALIFLVALAGVLWTRDRKAWLCAFLPAAMLVVVAFFATNYAAHNVLTPPYMHKGTDNPEENWYDYTYILEGKERESYWRDRQGIDRGEPSRSAYAFHVLVGHHGIFSLTPVWLISMLGLVLWSLQEDKSKRVLALGILGMTIVCLVFYIGLRPLEDRNYGGVCSGFRWMFWFAPCWLLGMLPALDRFADSRGWRMVALVFLMMSAFSASFPTWNPWRHPWIYRLIEYAG